MGIEHIAFDPRQRGARRLQLRQDIDAITALIDHRSHTAHLALNPPQTCNLRPVIRMAGHSGYIPPAGMFTNWNASVKTHVMSRILFVAALLANAPVPAFAQASPGSETPPPAADPHAGHDMSAMEGMPGMDDGDHGMGSVTAAFGPYSMSREASGTSWQPDVSPHSGVHIMAGDWTLMGHAMLNLVYDNQSGPRGDETVFGSGMVMGMATGRLSDRDTVQFRAMLSPDPLQGKRGYPILLAAGETADGVTGLVDRQHPHDLFMELSASYSRKIGDNASAFVYIGLPGEPAFGPPAFMHRLSIMDSPEAPITHHWMDSTHITYGVATAGVTIGAVKIEASRFKGREPDQNRYDIETPKFDSTAVRVSWNPSENLSLQASWARQKSPEQLSPEEDQEKFSASAIYTQPIGTDGYFATTIAVARKQSIEADGTREHALAAAFAEATWKPDARWTVFGRVEIARTDELLAPVGETHGPEFTVGKASLGVIRDFTLVKNVKLGVGGLVARSLTPRGLDPSYGGDRTSGLAFVRLKIG
jgi:hypothetical protein